jgi:hypothetical protein
VFACVTTTLLLGHCTKAQGYTWRGREHKIKTLKNKENDPERIFE